MEYKLQYKHVKFTNCNTNVSNLQIAKWNGVSPTLSWWFSHYKNRHFIWQFVNLTHLYCNLYSILICKQSQEKLFSSSYPSGKTGSSLKKTGWGLRKNRMRLGKNSWLPVSCFSLASSCLFLALFLFFLSPFLFYHRGLSYEKVFPSFVYILGKK
jgi:hypothetical protein